MEEVLAMEKEGILKIMEPTHGLEGIAGNEALKNYLRKLREQIRSEELLPPVIVGN